MPKGALRVSTAMQAGIAPTLWTFEDFIGRMDAAALKSRGPYQK